MLLNVSASYNNDTVAHFGDDDVVYVQGDDGCICCLHRKPDPIVCGVIDNPAFDWRAEVSAQKFAINHQKILFEKH